MAYKSEKAKEVADRMEEIGRAEMVRLSKELHGGLYAPSMSEYEAYACRGAGTRTFICKRFPGGWAVFAAACGLEMAGAKYYWVKAVERRAEFEALEWEDLPSMVEVGRERDRMERDDEGRGLAVCEVPRVDVWKSPKDGKVYQGLAWQVI
jgi:hypothetical protein